jgi:hypothetical protein
VRGRRKEETSKERREARTKGLKSRKKTKYRNENDMRKVKVKLSLCLTKHHAMKTYWGSGGIVPCILNLGTRRR